MRYHDDISIADIVALLATGGSYSTLAGLAGFADGTSFRRHCLTRGLKRKIRNGVVIVIAEPT